MRPMLGGPSISEAIGLVSGSTAGTTLTGHATPGSDGAWTELSASLARPSDRSRIVIYPGGVTGEALVQIGVGASGSEKIIAAGIPLCRNGGTNAPVSFQLPFRLAKSDRVAARVYRATAASWDCEIKMLGEMAGYGSPSGWRTTDTYGIDAANARGTVIDPGATANTEGSVTSLGTLTRRARQLVALPAYYGTTTWTTFVYWHWIRLYHRKASGTWRQLAGPLFTMAHQAVDNLVVQGQPVIDCDLEAGTELGATDQCQTGTSGRRNLSLVVMAGA